MINPPRWIAMMQARQLLSEIASSLRNVIAPAVAEPYAKSQAYMAAVILGFVARQVEERGDVAAAKQAALHELFQDLMSLPDAKRIARPAEETEAALCKLIERLYAQREVLGEEAFQAANSRIRLALRQILDQELRIAENSEG
jgi:hypothetical protein